MDARQQAEAGRSQVEAHMAKIESALVRYRPQIVALNRAAKANELRGRPLTQEEEELVFCLSALRVFATSTPHHHMRVFANKQAMAKAGGRT